MPESETRAVPVTKLRSAGAYQAIYRGQNGGRGGIRTHGEISPTFDFESSALNQTQPPFLLKISNLRRNSKDGFDFYTVSFYGHCMKSCKDPESAPSEDPVWTPTSVQFLYRHRNGRYYVRTFAHGKEKWTSLKTNLLSIAKNRMREHIDAAEKQRLTGESVDADGSLTFGQAMRFYQSRLDDADIRPNTKAFRESGLKIVLRTWDDIEKINVRRITSRAVENWLRDIKETAKPYVPNGAKTASRNSTGASVTTLKCALDSFRHVLDVAVDTGHLYANPARNAAVTEKTKKLFKVVRREKAERGSLRLPTRGEFTSLVDIIRNAGVSDCRAAADYVQFIAFSGARKTEASHVTWADIDLARETVRLPQ